MARAASETGAKLVAFSSDQVYSGAAQEGPLPETLSLSPSNIYGQHKLEAEQRVLEVLPDAVFLRVPWMYDLPGYQLPIRGNLPLNLLRAALRGTPVQFSAHDWRGISFVREVIGNLNPALSLPGGVYNFGSDNDRSMVETARQFAELLGISVAIEITNWHRNLRMDGCKAAAQGITFCSTQEGFARCLKEYNLSGGPR
jgi:dTDP-4-dehydrorhamnose reductase